MHFLWGDGFFISIVIIDFDASLRVSRAGAYCYVCEADKIAGEADKVGARGTMSPRRPAARAILQPASG